MWILGFFIDLDALVYCITLKIFQAYLTIYAFKKSKDHKLPETLKNVR